MGFHFIKQFNMLSAVKEHAAHYFCQNVFRRAGKSGVIQHVTLRILWRGEYLLRQPAHKRTLGIALLSLEQFHPTEHSAVLILPAASGSEQLFEREGAVANLVFIPGKPAEV